VHDPRPHPLRQRHPGPLPGDGPQLPRRAAGPGQQDRRPRRHRRAQHLRPDRHLQRPRGLPVIGSGLVSELNQQTPNGDSDDDPTFCNDALGGSPDPGPQLPAPIKINPVAGDCTQNQALVGTGDCSNTINGQYSQGGNAFDYTELRFTLQVPPDVVAFSYDFAFFSTEYPFYYGSQFNDMYVGWLESEKWTGNISFDQQGNPISLNAGFLEFKDDGGNNPVFGSTCMRQHAGTNWLTTKAGVTPGESITVVFAVFDLADPILDSYAFLDNFQWSCEPTGKPSTMPPA
jgi:hypothetical protein